MEHDSCQAIVEHNSCPICYEEISKSSGHVSLSCSHLFHLNCISRWLKNDFTCPICRTKVDEKFESIEKLQIQHSEIDLTQDIHGCDLLNVTKESLSVIFSFYCNLIGINPDTFPLISSQDFNGFTMGSEHASGNEVNPENDLEIIWVTCSVTYRSLLMWLFGKTGKSISSDDYQDLFYCSFHKIVQKQIEMDYDEESETASFFRSICDSEFARMTERMIETTN
jgi:hypothetical protein